MPRRRYTPLPEVPSWYGPEDNYEIDLSPAGYKSLVATGQRRNDIGKRSTDYRLDIQEVRADLLNKYKEISNEDQAEQWVRAHGLPAADRESLYPLLPANKIQAIVESAKSLKELLRITDLMLNDIEELKRSAIRVENGRKHKGLDKLVPLPPGQVCISFGNVCEAFCLLSGDLDNQEIPGINCAKVIWQKEKDKWCPVFARAYLAAAANIMLQRIEPILDIRQDESGQWLIVQESKIDCPWQGMALEFARRIQEQPVNINYCLNPACRASLAGKRSDARNCDKAKCERYVRDNYPRKRTYKKQLL